MTDLLILVLPILVMAGAGLYILDRVLMKRFKKRDAELQAKLQRIFADSAQQPSGFSARWHAAKAYVTEQKVDEDSEEARGLRLAFMAGVTSGDAYPSNWGQLLIAFRAGRKHARGDND